MNIKEILYNHKLWVQDDPNGIRANLSGANLFRANLLGANLSEADLSRANLSEADFSKANLSGANLYETDLSRANLFGANLSGANLSGADLSGADLSGADLSGADLSEANLYEANLSRANLFGVIGKEIMTFQFNLYFAYACDGYIKIGCKYLSISDWVEQFEQIGKENDYSEKEIVAYGDWIQIVNRRLK